MRLISLGFSPSGLFPKQIETPHRPVGPGVENERKRQMSEYPGMGVVIGMLGGNADTVDAYHASLNKTISSISINDDVLSIGFDDGSTLNAKDDGQSCCEHRYMVCDDDLPHFIGAKLTKLELKNAPNEPDDYGEHEVQFLEISTSNGSFSIANHNEHNGYYGGFWVTLNYRPSDGAAS